MEKEITLILEGLPDDFDKISSKLELYFKNKRRSGGEITELRKYPADDRKALLVYPEWEGAKNVLAKTLHKVGFKGFGDVELTVKLPNDDSPKTAKKKPPVAPRPQANKLLQLKKPTPPTKEVIADAPKDNPKSSEAEKVDLLLVSSPKPLHKDLLSMYFEKFSPTAEIRKHDDNHWIVELCTPSDVQKVLSQRAHKFGISVEVYQGNKPGCEKGSNDETNESSALLVTSTETNDREMLLMYFERFSENLEISKNGDTQWIVKFANQSDLQKCLAMEKHNLGISVEVYNEQVMQRRQDPRRFLLSGFKDSCKIKVVSLYIDSCSKGVNHTWEILDDEKILVTFERDIDIASFLRICSTKQCQKMEITATCVERADSVLVQGEMNSVSDDALMLYFSNKKRSQGGEVKSLTWRIIRTSAVITFEDCQVVSKVLEKKHHICDIYLSVSAFHSNLQKPLIGTAPSLLVKPLDITFPIKEALCDYITLNEVCMKEITSELGKVHCTIAFTSAPEPSLKLGFSAIPDSLLALRLGSSWESETRKATQLILDKYSVEELAVDPDVWTRIENEAIQMSSFNATVRYMKDAAKVVVVGLQGDVRSCMERVRQIVITASEELEKERNTIECQIQIGSTEELEFIWDRVHGKVKDVDFTKDDKSLTFVLKGLRDRVTVAEDMLKDLKNDVVNQPLPLSPNMANFINLAGPKNMEGRLAQNNIFISLSNQEESIQIIGEKTDIKHAEDKIVELLKEEEIPLSLDKEMFTQGEDWKEFYISLLSEVESSNNVLHLNVCADKIEVCGFSSVVSDVSHKLKGYLEDKKPTTEEVALTSLKEVEFVDSCMNLSDAPELKSLHATILANKTESSPGLKITAPSNLIKEAVSIVKNKLIAVVKDTLIYPNAGQSKVLEKNQHSLQAKAKEMRSKFFFTVQKPPEVKAAAPTSSPPQPSVGSVGGAPVLLSTPHRSPSPSPPSLGTDPQVTIKGVPVFLKKGDITKETVDVIVNSTNVTLDLDTGVSVAILKAAGQSVVDECTALGTQKNDGVALTSGGNLSCKHIAHMVGPTTAADITSSTEKVLGLCQGKAASSVSVPAIGTGRGGIAAQDSLRAILKGLENYLSRTTSPSIKTMNLVIFEQKVFDDCVDLFKKKNPLHASPVTQSVRGSLSADEVKISGVRIKVKKGNITTETVKSIVNTTNANMNLTGGVSGAIFKAAGTSVEQECKAIGSLQGNSAAVTSAGNLQCDYIIHMMGPHSAADATARVQKVLERCEEKGITTVSFPAVGTGGGGLKGPEAIIAMLQGMKDHLSQCTSTVLKLIYIVIDQDNILQDFLQGIKQWTHKEQEEEEEDGDTENEEADSEKDSSSASEEEEEDISDGKNTETLIGPIKVKVFCGDITKETTQAIVNSTNTSLDLSSGVSGAILKAAGKTVIDECKSKGTQPSDGVVLTQAGNMATKHIVHMVGQTKEKDITSSMYKTLQLCEQNNIQSVSFPALGTGAGNLGASQVALAMIDAVDHFTKDNPKALKAVHIVIFQTKMLPDFVEALKEFKKVKPQTLGGLLRRGFKTLERLTSSMLRSNLYLSVPAPAATPSVTFPVMAVEVYSTSPNDLQQVKKLLEDLLSEECVSEEVTSRHLTQLSKTDQEALTDISQTQQVEILTKAGDKLSVSGRKEDVLAAVVKIQALLLGVQERVTRESEEKRVYKTLCWEVAEGEVWEPFVSSVSYTIELAFHRNEKKVSFTDQGESYTVDLKEKTCTDSKGRKRGVKRTLLGDSDTAVIQYPATWTPMTGKIHDIVTLSNTSEEYKKIEKEFLKSSINPNQPNRQKYHVVKIERIQSCSQWQRYAVLKQTIDKRHPKLKNQQHLYHGTTTDIVKKINANGFNRSFCGRNATVHGEGTYFAKEAWYSCHDTYSNPDAQGLKYMYKARVLTGSPCMSTKGMKEPDPLDANNPQAGLHDCAVDNLQNPFIFVVFCDAGAYPDYLITFKNA